MSKVIKESFFEASFQTKEEFDSAEIAAGPCSIIAEE